MAPSRLALLLPGSDGEQLVPTDLESGLHSATYLEKQEEYDIERETPMTTVLKPLPCHPFEVDALEKGVPYPVPTGRQLTVSAIEVAASALWRLWHDLELGDSPLLFLGETFARHWQHHALLLDRAVEAFRGRKRARAGQIERWTRLPAPASASGIAAVPLCGPLLKPDLLRPASLCDRRAVPGACAGWYRYDFAAGWSALAVMLAPDEDADAVTITAVPAGRENEWLAFLAALREIHSALLRRKRKGQIEILGDGDELASAIEQASFADVILPEAVLEQVAAQRAIFSADVLSRYASFGVPRMRKVLLIGPPGTGKTTLLKAEAARHVQQGGHVFYVFAAKKVARSWELLSHALSSAAEIGLPTLIVVEDFEQFVSEAEDLQRVLNTLDGVATPDNPAGTLLLGSSNAPEQIDPRIKDRPGRIDLLIEVGLVEREDLACRFLQRFLGVACREEEYACFARQLRGQTGSHIREVCLLGAIHALQDNRPTVSHDDLRLAHETLLAGRAVAGQPERCAPPPAEKRGAMGFEKPR